MMLPEPILVLPFPLAEFDQWPVLLFIADFLDALQVQIHDLVIAGDGLAKCRDRGIEAGRAALAGRAIQGLELLDDALPLFRGELILPLAHGTDRCHEQTEIKDSREREIIWSIVMAREAGMVPAST